MSCLYTCMYFNRFSISMDIFCAYHIDFSVVPIRAVWIMSWYPCGDLDFIFRPGIKFTIRSFVRCVVDVRPRKKARDFPHRTECAAFRISLLAIFDFCLFVLFLSCISVCLALRRCILFPPILRRVRTIRFPYLSCIVFPCGMVYFRWWVAQ